MKVVAVHSSPRPKNLSHVGVMLTAFEKYLIEKRPDWEYSEIALWGLDINICDGNGRCFRREGCVFDDDAERVIEILLEADGVVLASPNYCANVNSKMMSFIERTTRLSHRRLLKGKGALALSTSASPFDASQAADYLRRVLGSYGASVTDACNIGSPLIVRDFGDNEHGRRLREHTDRFIAAVEAPEENLPDEQFGIDVRQSLRDHPEYARRLFRSDDKYFAGQEREGRDEAE